MENGLSGYGYEGVDVETFAGEDTRHVALTGEIILEDRMCTKVGMLHTYQYRCELATRSPGTFRSREGSGKVAFRSLLTTELYRYIKSRPIRYHSSAN